ncbi:hypothetical protein SB49_06140 [Sediminicola sp. YIK13]|uniref:hypothetical protein n=1 Tax=Sediminicola sp. YIK13 TaxID=1453352 RepID=UPI00071EBE66|nr:hypothetical protein [Sediminicola sp. YIK13]ALM07429.1 hypothetical protein SB49_06140 [Sediminicola sp. YIK13]
MQKLALIIAALITSIISTAQERPVPKNLGEISFKANSTTILEDYNYVIIHSKKYSTKSYNGPMACMVQGNTLQIANFPLIGWFGAQLLGKWNIPLIHSYENATFSTFC